MKSIAIIPLLLFSLELISQGWTDAWVDSQLDKIMWERTYKGVLADYHPITLQLASDHNQVVGYLIHQGDERKHKLVGDWSKSDRFQLQERDQYDRLTGYLNGSVTNDLVQMEWMSADQSRVFSVKAFPESLIKIKNFKPVSEWIVVSSTPQISLSVQKMDYGIVSGLANRDGHLSRFEGYCLDGTCSIWNTVIQNPDGAPIKVQMRQKDGRNYKASLNGIEYTGNILFVTPLTVKQYDNSMGFLDFVYPQLQGKAFDPWLSSWIDKLWMDGVSFLTTLNKPENSGRLVHRSSGWVEILDESDQYVSGLITYINPGATRRESFLWLKKEDQFVTQSELWNTLPALQETSLKTIRASSGMEDQDYFNWLQKVGYAYMVPTHSGVVLSTEFNMVFGDDLRMISVEESKTVIKKKYWKYFGW